MLSNLTFKGKLAYIWRISLFKATFGFFEATFEQRFRKFRATFLENLEHLVESPILNSRIIKKDR